MKKEVIFLASLIISFAHDTPSSTAAPDVKQGQEKDKLVRAWTTRQQSVSSFKFAWTSRHFIPKGSMLPRPQGPNIVPASDTSLDERIDLWMSKDRMKKTTFKQRWSDKSGGFVAVEEKGAFDGSAWRAYSEDDLGLLGTKHKTDDKTQFLELELLPIAVTYRPFAANLCAIHPETLQLSDQKAMLEDKECLILERREGRSPLVESWWVIPNCDYAVGRYVQSSNGKTVLQITISYVKDKAAGWVPGSWKTVGYYSKGDKVNESYDCKVTSYSINPQLTDADFGLTFPTGTRVQDLDEKQSYILREDGEKRLITPDEVGASYQDLLSTESGQAAPTAAITPWRKPLAITAAVLLVLVTLAVMWRRRVRKATPSAQRPQPRG